MAANQMLCRRHKKEPVAMQRVQNAQGEYAGTSKARCSRCSKIVDCAICPSCGNTICLSCYNKGIEQKGKPPTIGPSIGETSSL